MLYFAFHVSTFSPFYKFGFNIISVTVHLSTTIQASIYKTNRHNKKSVRGQVNPFLIPQLPEAALATNKVFLSTKRLLHWLDDVHWKKILNPRNKYKVTGIYQRTWKFPHLPDEKTVTPTSVKYHHPRYCPSRDSLAGFTVTRIKLHPQTIRESKKLSIEVLFFCYYPQFHRR